uniref:Uncharacterized protein n=1 Tax=Anguilla anguilla TaxID=7936 RepID=A0A0E9Q4X5_ANGAN
MASILFINLVTVYLIHILITTCVCIARITWLFTLLVCFSTVT